MSSTIVESTENFAENGEHSTTVRKTLSTIAIACLLPLVFFNVVQILAAFFAVEPHPPLAVIPMIVGTAGMGIAALALVRGEIREGYYLAIAFSVASMIGMGPHKLFMESGMFVAPIALLGFVAELILIVAAIKYLNHTKRAL